MDREAKDIREIKTIGVLTSGGDAPGMNAAIRAVTRAALANGIRVKGIFEGYDGLLKKNIKELGRRDVSLILGRGGTVLRSSRCDEFKQNKYIRRAAKICKSQGIDALVVLGGDGTFRGARDLASIKNRDGKDGVSIGIPCIGIPCTIDNDIGCTDYCIGFDTAVNTVTENIDRLRDTTASHNRCSVVEVMGRNCGDIALHAAINCGAVSVVIPEKETLIERDIIERMHVTLHSGKSHFIVIVAEGVTDEKSNAKFKLYKDAFALAREIQDKTSVETRATVLGHVQRGGSPSARDRIVAAEMGYHAVKLLKDGIINRVVSVKDSKIIDLDINTALEQKKQIDENLIEIAQKISIWDIVQEPK